MRSSFTGKPGMLVAAPSNTLIPRPLKSMIGVHHCSIEFKGGKDRMRERYEPKKRMSVITATEDRRSSSSSEHHLEHTLRSIDNVEMKHLPKPEPKKQPGRRVKKSALNSVNKALDRQFSTTLHSSFLLETLEDID